MPAEIKLTDEADPEVVARVRRELSAFNFEASGVRDGVEFFAAVDDDDGELVAAVDGWTWGGIGWVEHLWVDGRHRGAGHGSALLAAVEKEARTRGCTQLGLTTHSFQAPDFYRRHGFEVVGELPGYPGGHSFLAHAAAVGLTPAAG
jgi:ribosomal protein S18 acetylase RimI-like enzyme